MSATVTRVGNRSTPITERAEGKPRRPRIAFFDYPDVFEDFYPHYGVDQIDFARRWAATGNHRWVSLLQSEIGEVTWYSYSLAPEFADARHEVTGARVRITRAPVLHRALWRCFYLPPPAWRWRSQFHKYELVASYASLLSPRVLRGLAADAPDLLFLQDYSSGRFDVLIGLGRWLGIPVVAYHGGGWRWVAPAVKRRTVRRADLLLASSGAERARLVNEMGVEPRRAPVVLTPIDVEAFRPADRVEACLAAGLDPARRYLLFAGRLDDRVKRVSALIQAFASRSPGHPDVSLVIAGDGPDRLWLEQLAQEMAPGAVRFAGWIGARRLPAYLNAAECLVLPSLREGFPTVVGEALACGTPVVASRVGGVPELVRDGETGWLVEPGDDRGLGARIGSVLEDRASLAGMRLRARRTAVARVSPEAVAGRLRELLPIRAVRA